MIIAMLLTHCLAFFGGALLCAKFLPDLEEELTHAKAELAKVKADLEAAKKVI